MKKLICVVFALELSGCTGETLANCEMQAASIVLLKQELLTSDKRQIFDRCLKEEDPQFCRWLYLDENSVIELCMTANGLSRYAKDKHCFSDTNAYLDAGCYEPSWLQNLKSIFR